MARTAPHSAAFSAPPFRIDQRAQIFEAVRGHETAGGEFPKRVFDFAGQPFRFAHQIGEE